MANTIPSVNMNLPIPVPGVDPGPDWANNLNSCLGLVDAHDHSNGKGIQITPAGLNINSDLAFGGNAATNLEATVFGVQASDPPANLSVYVKGVDLYFTDGNGNHIKMTSGGGVNGSPGNIANLVSPASATYVGASGTFQWQQAVSTSANMDAATYVLRYPGSYPTPSGNFIALQAPASLATGYAITLPATLPSVQSTLTMDSSGNVIYVSNASANIASASIDWTANKLFYKTLSANTTFTFANVFDTTIVVSVTNTSGNYTVTWPNTVKWVDGLAPIQTIGAHTDIYTFVSINSIIYGNAVKNF